FLAHDDLSSDRAGCYSDDCQCPGRTNQGRDRLKTGFAFAPALPTGSESCCNIFVMPLISIVPALLYIKMRQLGGEPLTTELVQIEAGEEKQSAWQKRMRTRLSLHTPISQKTTTP